MNPFLEGHAAAEILCNRIGWTARDHQGRETGTLKGARKLVVALFNRAEREGYLEAVVAHFRQHVAEADAARVRETTVMLANGYDDMVALFRR